MGKDLYSGDVALFNTLEGGAIQITNGQPLMDQGLETAVYISLFTGESWQNDLDSNNISRQNFARLESVFTRQLTNKTRLDAIEFARDSLAWLINDKIADKIIIDAAIISGSQMLILIDIIKPENENAIEYKYIANWENQEFYPAHDGVI